MNPWVWKAEVSCFCFLDVTIYDALFRFSNHVLHKSAGIEEMGLPSWQLALCLLLAWFITALVLLKGVQSLGKVI